MQADYRPQDKTEEKTLGSSEMADVFVEIRRLVALFKRWQSIEVLAHLQCDGICHFRYTDLLHTQYAFIFR